MAGSDRTSYAIGFADLDHEDAKRIVLYVADDSVIAGAVAPVRAEMWAGQRLTCGARVIEHG